MISCHRIDILGLFSYQVASLRSFGMTVFYFMMGIYIHIDADFFKARFGVMAKLLSWNTVAATAHYTHIFRSTITNSTLVQW